jgi:hypothetical protein
MLDPRRRQFITLLGGGGRVAARGARAAAQSDAAGRRAADARRERFRRSVLGQRIEARACGARLDRPAAEQRDECAPQHLASLQASTDRAGMSPA